ncbi:ENASE-like protein [Mya arenaria]|uniref:ENASE-like protein n=1 Tax=Mya arenaria TaxID=6604 RepID=A0ABY7DGN7_MYAAR|nr:ENASE-like protein [Mya arenaria]
MDRRNPVCKPLFDLDEVLSWQPAQDEFCVSSVARRPRKEQDGPRMLVCHDMRGGYLEDRSRIWNPISTEWDDGKARCKIFLETEESYKAFADQLVKIAKYYGFDGWLINIENVIEPVGNPWWNITVQDLQPCFCQTHSDNQSAENQSSTGTQSILPGSQPFMSGAGTQSAMLGTKPGLPGAGNGAQLIGNPIPTIGTGKSFLGGSQEFCGNALQQMDVCTDDCFTGGSCLRLTADVVNTKFVEYNLFETAVELKQYTSVYVSITYKILQDPDCDVFLELHLRHDEQSIVLVLLPFPDGDKPVPKFGKDTACMYVHALKQTDLPNLLSVSSPTQNNTRWKTRWFPVYSLYLKFCQLTKVKVGLTTTDPQPKKCIALLGELKIIPVDSLPEKFPQAGFVSVIPDSSPAHPLIEPGKNDFNNTLQYVRLPIWK